MNRAQRRRNRNGSAYVLLLSGALVVVVAGVTAVRVTTTNIKTQGARKQGDTALRQAQAGLEYMMLRIVKDPGGLYWRETASFSGGMSSPTGTANTAVQIALRDPADGDLTNGVWGDVDCRVRATTGDFSRQIGVTLRPTMQRMRCLDLAVGALKFSGGGTVLASGGNSYEYNSNATSRPIIVDWVGLNDATGLDVTADAASSNTMADAADQRLPEAKVIDYWAALGTKTTLSADRVIQNALFSPTSNPLGAANALGIYVIDVSSHKVIIQNCRVYGTLILYGTGKDKITFDKSNCLQPASWDRPALLVSGGVTFSQSSTDLSEVTSLANFNPSGAPFRSETDIDVLDTYPSLIRGLVYVDGEIDIKKDLSVQGQVFTTGVISRGAQLHVQYYPIEGTPIGFSFPTGVQLVDGSVVRY